MIRSVLKVMLWISVFAASAGVGAYIAANTNPFPPEVRDGPTGSPSVTSPPPVPERWRGQIRSTTIHELYVGGTCTTRWSVRLSFEVGDEGISGSGTARRTGDLRCTFELEQIQVDVFELDVAGRRTAEGLVLRLVEAARDPTNADDYGGFSHTLLVEGTRSALEIPYVAGRTEARAKIRLRRPDEEARGTYASVSDVRLACVAGCTG